MSSHHYPTNLVFRRECLLIPLPNVVEESSQPISLHRPNRVGHKNVVHLVVWRLWSAAVSLRPVGHYSLTYCIPFLYAKMFVRGPVLPNSVHFSFSDRSTVRALSHFIPICRFCTKMDIFGFQTRSFSILWNTIAILDHCSSRFSRNSEAVSMTENGPPSLQFCGCLLTGT
jgi:hypothetical protein